MNDESGKNSDWYECSLQLVPWAQGTDLLEDIVEQMELQLATLQQLLQWKRKYLLHPKPTSSTSDIFVFWVQESVIDQALHLTSVRGGFQVSELKPKLPDSSTYRGKKQSPRPRRVLLDVGCDNPALIHALTQLGLEIELVWRHAADLLNYEIIEICTAQYIDLFVSTNNRVLTPPEEWLTYLLPHRTRLFFPPKQVVESQKALAQAIYQRARAKRKRIRGSSQQLQQALLRTLGQKTSSMSHSRKLHS